MKTPLRRILENAPKQIVRDIGEIIFRDGERLVTFDRFEVKFLELDSKSRIYRDFAKKPLFGGLKRSIRHAWDLYYISNEYGLFPALEYEVSAFGLKKF